MFATKASPLEKKCVPLLFLIQLSLAMNPPGANVIKLFYSLLVAGKIKRGCFVSSSISLLL
jgi:hypothetical protein